MREKSSEKNKEYKNRMNYLKQQEGQLQALNLINKRASVKPANMSLDVSMR